jgi:hypothetical protein
MWRDCSWFFQHSQSCALWICFEKTNPKPTLHIDTLRYLQENVQWKHHVKWNLSYWFLHHDNAPAHSALLVGESLAKNKMIVIAHPPYSPSLVPCDFFHFSELKMALKGRSFNFTTTIQATLWDTLPKFQTLNFIKCFEW